MRLIVLVLIFTGLCAQASETWQARKVLTEAAGVYAVDFDQLAALGDLPAIKSAEVMVHQGGRAVPVLVDDGGDGVFESGDRLVFVGERLSGEHSFHHPYARYQTYIVEQQVGDHPRLEVGTGRTAELVDDSLFESLHLEQEKLRLRFALADEPDAESWFWHKLSSIDRSPTTIAVPIDNLASAGEVELTMEFKGWSNPRQKPDPEMTDHEVVVGIGDQEVGRFNWNGQNTFVADGMTVTAAQLRDANGEVAVAVTSRRPVADQPALVDVVMLNWAKVELPLAATLNPTRSQQALTGRGRLHSPGTPWMLVSGDRLFKVAAGDTVAVAGNSWAVLDEQYLTPTAVGTFAPLDDLPEVLDYLVISHASLMSAVEPLVDYHRGQGMQTALVDVERVYDRYAHGVVDAQAIRDLLLQRRELGGLAMPRYVLLVGDASWDIHNEELDNANYMDISANMLPKQIQRNRFSKIPSTPLDEPLPATSGGLIPTYAYGTYDGLAATDNWFVADLEDSAKPFAAIGRFPTANADEVRQIVDKTITYMDEPEVGPWRRRMLWISNEERGFQMRSDRMVADMATRGFGATKVYPERWDASMGDDQALHQQRLRDAFNQGNLITHFYGHGGRFIWRTSQADYRGGRDLFRLDDLDLLQSHDRLSIVISMTCYSAPFDHPTEDSIGEKFLRLDDKGAIAVIAASWRNSPSPVFSQSLVQSLTEAGTRLGDGFVAAKRASRNRQMIQQYNLLGDPALAVSLPGEGVITEAGGELIAHFGIDSGAALVEWFDLDGAVVNSAQLRLEGGTIALPPAEGASRVTVYAWNDESRRDGLATWAYPAANASL